MKKTSLPTNDFIWVADALPHDNPTIEKVKKVDFAKKHGFTWSEHYYFDDNVSAEEQAIFHAELDEHLLTHYDTSLAEIEDNLMLCPMAEAGYGAFTRKEIKNGPVAIYIGQYYTKKTAVVHRPDQNVHAYTLTTPKKNVFINSYQYRNMASYIQHLFSAESPDILFNREPSEHFAVSNLVLSEIIIRGWPVMIIGSISATIPKMTLLGYNYSLQYFNHLQIQPILFRKNGLPFSEVAYQPCTGELLELRVLGLKLYQHLDAWRRTDKSTPVSLDEFSQRLKACDFDILRSTAVSCTELSETVRRKKLPIVWTDSSAFISLLSHEIKNRLEFMCRMELYLLMYSVSEILSRCTPEILTQLAHPFPKQFNYCDLFRQGFSDASTANAMIQAIILKNTGKGRVAKPSFQSFFDHSKAFFYFADSTLPQLKQLLLSEYSKYKVTASSPAAVPSSQFHHQPSPQNKPEISTEEYKALCRHLNTVFAGEWKYHSTKKNIWIEGNQHTLNTLKSHLEDNNVTGVSLRSVNKIEDKYCLILSDPKSKQITALSAMTNRTLENK